MKIRSNPGALALAFTLAAQGAAGQAADESLPVGTIVDRIVTSSDTTQSYAFYLPSNYDPARGWPIVYAMDPRGRALVPLRLFQDAAERRGYIVVSSYNTLSDQMEATDINDVAMEAMLADTQRRFNLDVGRLYLAGFSGTARVAWDFARRLPDNVPGIIGFGAGFPFPASAIQMFWDTSLVFYGGSGVIDFNYEEMRTLDGELTRLGFRHLVEYYPGPHAWPNGVVASDALEWMEMQAMRRGLTPLDQRWLAELANTRVARARSAEEGGDLFEAHRQYATLVKDFEGLTDVSGARRRWEALTEDPAVRGGRERRDGLATAEVEYRDALAKFLGKVRTDRRPPSFERAMNDLDVEELLERAANGADRLDALAAQRMAELTFVHLSFYEPRFHFQQRRPARALAVLRVARAIKPRRGDVCFDIARAHALLDQPAEAFEALDCAIDNGWRDVDALRGSPDLESLRTMSGYEELLQRVQGR